VKNAPPRSFLLTLLLAAVSGAVWGLAFGRHPWSVASWAALAPLPLLFGAAPGRGSAALVGFVHGLAAWLTAVPWIAPTLRTFGSMPSWLAVLCLLLLASYLAAFHALFAAFGRELWRRPGAADGRLAGALTLLALPALWVALEWLRAHLFGGFPWNLAAYAWVNVPGALPTSAWIGAYGVSYLVLLANVGLALALARRRWSYALGGLLLPVVLLAAGGRWGAGDAAPRDFSFAAGGAPVRLVQPDVPNTVEPNWAQIRANYARVLDMSEDACTPGSLVVWPESAAWPYSFSEDAGFRRDVTTLARRGGCSVLFNSVQPEGGRYFNSAYLLSPDGEVTRYDKRKLVPFGEYVPLAGVFTFIDKLARNAGDFRAADELVLLPWHGAGGDELLGPAICYEVVFPEQVAQAVRAGATILVTITNDAWYGDTAAPWQHYAAARFRAAESRRPLLRAAITGISALVAADGAERARLDPFTRGVIRAGVTGETELSPYTRAPWLVPLLCTLLAAAAPLLRSQRPGRRVRGSSPGPSMKVQPGKPSHRARSSER